MRLARIPIKFAEPGNSPLAERPARVLQRPPDRCPPCPERQTQLGGGSVRRCTVVLPHARRGTFRHPQQLTLSAGFTTGRKVGQHVLESRAGP